MFAPPWVRRRWARRRVRVPVRSLWAGGEPRSVTFPSTPLVSRVQVALGADLSADPLTWAWADITDRVRYDPGISLAVGGRDELSGVGTGKATLQLDNTDGRFTRRNPTSPYYGLLSKNTPIWATVDAGAGEMTRLEMFVNEWPNRWPDKSLNDTVVAVQCAGVMRRLRQGRRLKSALRRAILAASPVAYWPLEDGFDATAGSSAVTGGQPMGAPGVTFAGESDLPGSAAAPSISTGGSLSATVSGLSSTSWWHCFAVKSPFFANNYAAFQTSGSTTHASWFVAPAFFAGDGPYVIFGTADNLTTTGSILGPAVDADWENTWHFYGITAEQVGSNVRVALYVDGVLQGTNTAAGTLGPPVAWQGNPNADDLTSMAHVAFGSGTTLPDPDSLMAYTGEMAHVRMGRLCAEEGVLFTTTAAESSTMGPQGTGGLLNLLNECAATDLGALYEKRWGLAYKSRREYYNQNVGLALDFDQKHIAETPEPADDDQRTRNVWTVARTDGSEATIEEATGPMGTRSQGPGVYDDGVTLNLETDDQLRHHANWLVHVGTVDEDRWPSIALNFARQPGLIGDWTALPFGARTTADNPPDQMPPDPLDLVIEGHSEFWNNRLWTANLNCSPNSVNRVVVVGSTDGNLGRVDMVNSTLAADATSVDATISVASSGSLWRTGAVDFDIGVAGERMTVTNIAGASSPQTFTVTRSVNGVVKAQPSAVGGHAVKVSLWRPAVYAL